MVLATLVLLCAVPQTDDAAKVAAASNAHVEQPALSLTASDSGSKDSTVAAALPSAPEPKVKPEAEPVALPFQPVRPAPRRVGETPRQRKTWYALMAVGHAAAGFDAWTTRRAVSSGYGQEANPFLRPFANSNAIYAATQMSPTFMDFIGKRMMVSQNPWIRKLWWVPQMAGASVSFYAGRHNLGVVH